MSDFDKNLVFWSPFLVATLVAAVLKLAGVIDWPWWIVALPILLPYAILLLLAFVFIVMVGTLPRRQR